MTEHTTPSTAAPLPPDPAHATAAQYAAHATARVIYLTGYLHEAATGTLDDKYFRVLNAMLGDYATAYLTRALIEHAPDKADEIVRGLGEDFEAGDSVAESAWEWATEAGMNVVGLSDSGAAGAKEDHRRSQENAEGVGPVYESPEELAQEITRLNGLVEQLQRELAATCRAKAENDERFQLAAAQAREELAARLETHRDNCCCD